MTIRPPVPIKNRFSWTMAALAAIVIAIVPLLGALVAAPAATAGPQQQLAAWAALLAAPRAISAVDRPDADIVATLSELAPVPSSTSASTADAGHLSDLQSVGMPTEDPAFAQTAIRLGHAIVDDLHATPTCSEVISVAANGLDAGLTPHQVARMMVSAAIWYGPDLVSLLKSCADTYSGTSTLD